MTIPVGARDSKASLYASFRTRLAAGDYFAGQFVFCEGRGAVGDGAEGFWQVKDIGALTDNDGTILTGGSLAAVRVFEGAVNVKWFGAVGDGVADDSPAIQAALDSLIYINNTSGIANGGGQVYLPYGRYLIETSLSAKPSTAIRGENIDASVLVAGASLAEAVVQFHRPDALGASFTRRYSLSDLKIVGSNVSGSIGLSMMYIAEFSIERVGVFNMDVGIYLYDTIVGKFDACRVYECTTYGIQAEYRCNAISVSNSTRVGATKSGPNISVDGPDSYGWLFDCPIIESAGTVTAALGHGIEIGATGSVTGVSIIGAYMENNFADSVRIGSLATTVRSEVFISGGTWSVGASATGKYGIRAYGALVHCVGFSLGSFSSNQRIVVEATTSGLSSKLYNLTDSIPYSSDAAQLAAGFSFDNNAFHASTFRMGGHSTDYGQFIKRPNDVAYQGDKPLWVQTEFRTAYQGSALLSSGSYTVTFSTPAANASFVAIISTEGTDHVRVGSKSTTGFVITSANGADTSRVHWLVLRNQ